MGFEWKRLLWIILAAGGLILFAWGILRTGDLLNGGSALIRNELAEMDIFLNWKSASWKYPLSFTLRDFSFSTKEKEDFPSFKAGKVLVAFHPARFFRGVLIPITLRIENGKLLIPLFPENAGKKKMDEDEYLLFSDLELDLKGITGQILVRNFSGRIGEGRFLFSGTINNFLHSITASFFGSLQDSLLRDPKVKKKNDIKTAISSLFSFQLPLETRRDLNRYKLEFQKENRSFPFLLHSKFHLDCNDHFRNRLEGLISSGEFRWRKVSFLPLREKFTLSGGVFDLPGVTLRTPAGDRFSFSGRYDGKKETFSGVFKGKSSPLLWERLFKSSIAEKLKSMSVSFGKEISFSGRITSWKIGEKDSFRGELDLGFPLVKAFDDIEINDGQLALRLENGTVKGDFTCKNIGKNIPFEKNSLIFQQDEKGNVTLSLSGKAKAAVLFSLPPVKKYLPEKFSFSPGDDMIFSFRYSLPSSPGMKENGVLEFSLPSFRYETMPFRNIRGKLELREDLLVFRYLRGSQENMSLGFTGEALFKEKTFHGNIRIQGSPGKDVIHFLTGRWGAAGKYLLDNLVFPRKGALAELSGNFFYRGKQGKTPPFWYWDGTLVMEDFSWQKVPFTYFSGRILGDSSFKGALYGATLQSKKGEAVLSLLYDPGREKEQGAFQWELKSHLSGNEILKSLLPEISLGDFDFPFTIPLTLSGTTSLTDPKKDVFRGTVTNGSFYWRDLLLSHTDALVEYKNETLFIRNAVGNAANGRIAFGYSYDFAGNKGDLEVNLENGNLAQILKVLKTDFQDFDTSRGKITGSLKTAISSPENSSVTTLEGKGKAVILGDDLWKIPIFGEVLNILGKTWNTRNLGSITEVNADFSLSGTKFIADKIRSNGSVVGIQMNGYYDWEKEDLDFRIRSELLRGTLPFEAMSKVLSPVSWILEKRLRGKNQEKKWHWFVGEQSPEKKP